ncbi:MAG: hypothetical protein ACJ739_05020 [Acidimicrobiales bacterium]
MSDQSQGPGWWLASDGRWYPPDQAPAVPAPEMWATPPPGPPPPSGMSTGAKVAIGVVGGFVALIVLSILAIALLGDEAETKFERTGSAIDEGDSSEGTTAPKPVDLPDGYALIEGDGVSIAAPDDWKEVDPDDFGMTPEEFEAAFPDAPEGFVDQAMSAFQQGASLVAFDVDDQLGANVNIASFPGEAPLSLVEQQAKSQLESLGGTVSRSERVNVPAGEAHRIDYTLDVSGPGGSSVSVAGVQFYVVADGRTHVVTITTPENPGDLVDTMIDTFRVT